METTIKKKIELAIKIFEWAKSHKLYFELDVITLLNEESRVLFRCQAESYKFVHEFSRLFKMKFVKSESANEACLNYSGKTEDMEVLLYAISELPPSCRVEYETIKVPEVKAHTKTIAKVVCK